MRAARTPSHLVEIPEDGRTLAVDVIGPADGRPVFLMHGTPGSRLGPYPRPAVLHRMNVRLISYDRPGFGHSTRDPDRTVADAAWDVRAIARFLEIPAFAVLGRSGGGPHAMAAAALLPRMVTQAAVLVPLAPSDATELDWFGGMNESNLRDYTSAEIGASELAPDLRAKAEVLRDRPDEFIDDLLRQVNTDRDQAILRDSVFRQKLRETYREGVRQGADGWIDDVLAMRRPWKFDLSDVRCPVKIWHGSADEFSPVRHSDWLKSRLPQAELEIGRGAGHFSAMEELPALLTWLSRGYPAALANLGQLTPSW